MHARGRCYGLPECIVVDVVLVTPRRTAGKTTVPSVCSSQAGSHVKCRESSSGQRAGEVRAANQAGSVHRKNDPGLALVEGCRRWDAYTDSHDGRHDGRSRMRWMDVSAPP